jgi:hypothetical protein
MKKLSSIDYFGALSVLLPSAIGLWIVGRTLAVYGQRDLMASAVVATMAVVLILGALELLLRHFRAAQLELEVSELPTNPSEATVDGASPLLGLFLRARLEQAPAPNLGESIAPYLTGLLVMLGLLGTLLGLFETVHGASHALTASADVSALRASLSQPISGLTRSFGCSAAGISASAMLGLALALVRRREGRALRAVHRYAMGPLRLLAPVRRQARALEQLAAQGLTLPQASSALERVGAQLGELSTRLVALQTAGVEAQKVAVGALVVELRGELARLSAEAGSTLHASVAPMLEQAAARAGESSERQARALAEVARDLTQQLDADARERAQHAAELLASLAQRMDAAEQARSAAQRKELELLQQLATRGVDEAQARERALEARWAELTERAEQSARLLREEESERLLRLDGVTTRMSDDLARVVTAVDEQLGRRMESERVHDERSDAALTQLRDTARAFESSSERQRGMIEQWVAALPPLFNEVAEAAQRGSASALGQLVSTTEARLERISATLDRELSQRKEGERAHDERTLAAMERLGQTADLLERSIAEQREALEGMVQRAGGLIAELATTARSSAESTLARLADSAEEQAMRWAKLESELADGRLEHARGLEQQLTGHAEQLERRLADAAAVVQQAAAIWKASSAEMQAIAQLFASSVERQREASDAWLESLGDIEAAVERSGRHAAADALADQLSSTQEVFARQLQFQRELFEQLRSLRASARVAPVEHEVGGHDVSV